MICDISLFDPIKIHPCSTTDEIFLGIHCQKEIHKVLPIESIFFGNITNALYVTGIISSNMGGVRYKILIVLIMYRLVFLSELKFGSVSFEVGLSQLSIRSSRVYKSTE